MLLKIENLVKIYKMGNNILRAIDGINLNINSGEFLAITGTSGSGKSTLMHLLGCLDKADEGNYFLEGKNVINMTKDQLAKIRNQKIGFVFQKFNLLTDLTAIDNIALPRLYSGDTESNARNEASKLLDLVELGDRKNHYPYQLSGGQQQRVAIARALINSPDIILADEPTGNLDTETGEVILSMFKTLNIEKKVTIILVTHELKVANKTNRIIDLRDGKIVSDTILHKTQSSPNA